MGRPWITMAVLAGCRQIYGLHDTELTPQADGASAGDAAPHDVVNTVGDRDGDGVLDGDDNCPDTPNPQQDNEDRDRFGDVCDPCPFVADDHPIDTDNDGVADACDPHPTTPGDRIIAFEGFRHGVPPGWQTRGTWDPSSDDLSTIAISTDAELTMAVAPVGMLAIYAQIVPTAIGDPAWVGTVGPFDPMHDLGISCDLFASASHGVQEVILWDDVHQGGPAHAMSVAVNMPYVFTQTWLGTAYTCKASVGSSSASVSNSNDTTSLPARAGVLVDGANAKVEWVMLVDQGSTP